MAILKYAMISLEKRLRASPDLLRQPMSEEETLRFESLLTRAKDAMTRMEQTHGDFKLVVYEREIEDGHEPLHEVQEVPRRPSKSKAS